MTTAGFEHTTFRSRVGRATIAPQGPTKVMLRFPEFYIELADMMRRQSQATSGCRGRVVKAMD